MGDESDGLEELRDTVEWLRRKVAEMKEYDAVNPKIPDGMSVREYLSGDLLLEEKPDPKKPTVADELWEECFGSENDS